MEYTLAFAAYDGPFSYYVGDHGFETKAEAEMFLAEANNTPEWQKYREEAGR